MGEPLKNKLFDMEISTSGQKSQGLILKKKSSGEFTKTESIKLAVEWLREEINKITPDEASEDLTLFYMDTRQLIEEAFSDVIEVRGR